MGIRTFILLITVLASSFAEAATKFACNGPTEDGHAWTKPLVMTFDEPTGSLKDEDGTYPAKLADNVIYWITQYKVQDKLDLKDGKFYQYADPENKGTMRWYRTGTCRVSR